MSRTTAIGYYHQNMVGLCQKLTDHLAELPDGAPRERMWRVRAGQVVLAQGALERPLVFDGNDRPGVMLAGAAQTYLNRYGVKVGDRVVVATSHDSAWHTAFDLADAGVAVAAIVDTRSNIATTLLESASAKSDRDADRPHRHRHQRAPAGVVGAGEPGPRRQRRRGAQPRLRRAADVRRLDAVAAPLLPHQGHAALGRGGRGVPARPQGRGLPHRRRRPRPLGYRQRAERWRQRPAPRHRPPPASRPSPPAIPSRATARAAASPTRSFRPTAAPDGRRPSSTSRTT